MVSVRPTSISKCFVTSSGEQQMVSAGSLKSTGDEKEKLDLPQRLRRSRTTFSLGVFVLPS